MAYDGWPWSQKSCGVATGIGKKWGSGSLASLTGITRPRPHSPLSTARKTAWCICKQYCLWLDGRMGTARLLWLTTLDATVTPHIRGARSHRPGGLQQLVWPGPKCRNTMSIRPCARHGPSPKRALGCRRRSARPSIVSRPGISSGATCDRLSVRLHRSPSARQTRTYGTEYGVQRVP